MTTELLNPEKEYPYMAVFTGTVFDGNFDEIEVESILVISMQRKASGCDLEPYAHNLTGGVGYFLSNEDEYTPLPKGFKVTLTQ